MNVVSSERSRYLLSYNASKYLGIPMASPPENIAEYLIRQASGTVTNVPRMVAGWFADLADSLAAAFGDGEQDLSQLATKVADGAVVRLSRSLAPSALAIIAPVQQVPACQAMDLAKVCRVLVARHLAGFCFRVLRTWEEDGHVRPGSAVEWAISGAGS
jgi:hypothetical protein